MRISLRIIISFFLILTSTAGNTGNTSKTIDIEEAKELWDRGVLFVDSRSVSNYNSGGVSGLV